MLGSVAMRITWAAYHLDREGSRLASRMASVRYRALLPAAALATAGHEVKFLQLTPDLGIEEAVQRAAGDVLVVSKLTTARGVFEPITNLAAELIRRSRAAGVRVLMDVTDDNFSDPVYGPFLTRAVNECDGVVASTPAMAAIVSSRTSCPVRVVGDPYEGPRGSPRFDPPSPRRGSLLVQLLGSLLSGGRRARPLRLLWYGHQSNFESLVHAVPSLHRLTGRCNVDLHVVTKALPEIASRCEQLDREGAPLMKVRLTEWSTEAVWRALGECDIVVIPSRPDDPAKAVKSPNRVVEGIRAGRLVCASPVPSYRQLSGYAYIGEDLAAGIDWALSHPREVLKRLKAGQEHVARNYSPEAIGRQWEAALSPRPVGDSTERGVRLNLGCGDKIIPGYINVDVADARNEQVPDVVCDIRQLTVFSSDTADEILSVHVIEHFWRWEAPGVLKEWVRVLRPGGRMIIECPNLISACRDFLEDPDRSSGPGPEGQRTMWVFYGDPAWRDPLMIHRWGYTPDSLGRLMAEAGLVNIRQEPAQFKLREPRDMRVVGEKAA
jgi:SAM-dependent methyltransferase